MKDGSACGASEEILVERVCVLTRADELGTRVKGRGNVKQSIVRMAIAKGDRDRGVQVNQDEDEGERENREKRADAGQAVAGFTDSVSPFNCCREVVGRALCLRL